MGTSHQDDIKQFAIFSLHRTGSSLLVDILDRIPSIKCYYELYKPDTEYSDQEWIIQHGSTHQNWKERNKAEPLAYWNEIVKLSSNSKFKAIGFKIFWDQNQTLLKYIADSPKYQKIILLRNPIARYISTLRAKATGKWFQIKTEPTARKLVFDPDEFELFLRDHICGARYYLRKAKEFPDKYLNITYEDVISRNSIKNIFDRLEINDFSEHKLTTQYAKQFIEPIDSCFLNYDQMKDYLISNHSSLLNEPGCPKFF